MAQIISPLPANGVPMITPEELHEIQEYEKIVKFRDAVFAGTHPTVKLPHPVLKSNATRNVSSPSLHTPRADAPAQPPTSGSHYGDLSPAYNNKSPNNNRTAAGGHGQMASRSEINPILLEKSDDLIKAEIQLQRQRLERALRDQLDHQRLLAKAMLQTSESLPDFDLADVLSKALTIVHPSAAVEPSVDASASDSFDENTFYSSQHDTPEPSSPLQGQKKSVTEEVSRGLVSLDDERPLQSYSTQTQVRDQDVVMTGASLSKDNNVAGQAHSQDYQLPSNIQSPIAVSERRPLQTGFSDSSSSGELNIERTRQDAVAEQKATKANLQQRFVEDVASPLIRAHNLSPIAPQPARVSPLITAREPPILRENYPADDIQPAQVAALRQDAPGISSTNSSPKRSTRSELRKAKREKNKKRKSSVNNDIGERQDSPYIKPEPRSPSPYAVAPLPRPNKRLRQYASELNYDEPADLAQERGLGRQKEAPVTRIYEDQYAQEAQRPRAVYQRLEPEEGNYRRVQYVEDDDYRRVPRRVQSPSVYTLPYAPTEGRTVRAVSHAVAGRRVYEEPVYYREPASRASVRPDGDRERSRSPIMRERISPIPMGPPRRPVRIIIDEHGREYIDPTPPPIIRHSVAPQARYRDQEIVYERAPPSSVSGRAPIDTYEEDGVVYRRQTPPLAIPRRLVAQPEYSMPPEYRSYRQREYSIRPMAPPGEEYVQIRGAPERRQMSHFEEPPREYISRAPSVRPEPVRYEIPREYAGRLQSVRPEAPPREYASSVRPGGRREVMSQSQREYSVRPAEHPSQGQQITEGARYYEEATTRRPAEVTYIDRPRAREPSVMVYADEPRREVYR